MAATEERSGLLYKTRGNVSCQGKSKIYFCAHPADFKNYFEEISRQILALQPSCAIFYCENGDNSHFSDIRRDMLSEMQLFVMPVSKALLTAANPDLDQEFALAQKLHIPVLPLMEDEGLETLFNKKYGMIQFLDPHCQDPTAIPYEEKLKRYLESILIGDDLADQITAAFDARIFLSYRKQDRKYAQELMRRIHQNDFCQGVSIWYDEFLVPGEDFNEGIEAALTRCDLFTLLVTPGLLEPGNYVLEKEYPPAQSHDRPILPVLALPTNHHLLHRLYPDLPRCVYLEDETDLSDSLKKLLEAPLSNAAPWTPRRRFLVGLAYLGGVKVETDRSRGLTLIRSAAEQDLPEACEKLVSMYKNGEGVTRSYETAALWQEKLTRCRYRQWQEEPTEVAADRYMDCLKSLGGDWLAMRRLEKAWEIYETLLRMNAHRLESQPDSFSLRNMYSVCCSRLGDIADLQGNIDLAEDYYRRSLTNDERLEAEFHTEEIRRGLAVSYDRMGDVARERAQLDLAEDYHRKSLALREQLMAQTGSASDRQSVAISYGRLGGIATARGDLSLAEFYARKGRELFEQLVAEFGSAVYRRGLASRLLDLGDIAQSRENTDLAEEYFRKSLELYLQLDAEMGSRQSRRDLSTIYERMGNIAKINRQPSLAWDFYQKAFGIDSQQAEEIGTIDTRRNLSITCGKLGDLAREQGQPAQAEAYYRRSLEIDEALSQTVGTVQHRQDLSFSCDRLGLLAEERGDLDLAESYYRRAYSIDEQIAADTGTPQALRNIAYSRQRLERLAESRSRLKTADLKNDTGSAVNKKPPLW